MKKIKLINKSLAVVAVCIALSATTLLGRPIAVSADAELADDNTIVTLGADLDESQRATVLSLLGLSEDELADCTVLEITNQDEHDYLDDYLSSSVIGNRALSSIRLDKADEGSGITVTTNNINYCTESMYVNALATAGVEDANVVVAGPFSISGTAALVGTMKAYEQMTGEEIDEDVMDAATDELVMTGEISDSVGDAEKASELIGLIKNEVVSQDASSASDIQKIIEESADQMGIQLSQEDIDKITSTMQKISKLDLNLDSLKQQAQGLYDKLDSLNIDLDQAQGFFDKFLEFFKNIYHKIVNTFS
jgi:uncharacterized protein YpuA (DUF1002 family)